MHGVGGLLLSPVIGAMVTGFFTVFFGTACVVGLWVFSKVRPLSLWAKNVVHHPDEAA